ncbi:siderophore-interacting protein [Rhizobiaceae sp. 2RAB30]
MSQEPVPMAGRPNLRSWDLSVIESFDTDPNMRRVLLTSDDLAEMQYRPGQALVLMLPGPDGTPIGRRDYTIRALDQEKAILTIDFVLHGDTPAPNWARSTKPGDRIAAKGPRGNVHLRPDAEWHLDSGDETCIPAIAHMLECAPAGARILAFIEVTGATSQIALETEAEVDLRWVHRGGAAPGPSDLMLAAVENATLPAGRGHACLIGETSNVRKLRHALLARGFPRDRIASEGYWRPGRIGGHDHVDD